MFVSSGFGLSQVCRSVSTHVALSYNAVIANQDLCAKSHQLRFNLTCRVPTTLIQYSPTMFSKIIGKADLLQTSSYDNSICCVRGASRHGQDSDVTGATTRKSGGTMTVKRLKHVRLSHYLYVASKFTFGAKLQMYSITAPRNTSSSSLHTSASGTSF